MPIVTGAIVTFLRAGVSWRADSSRVDRGLAGSPLSHEGPHPHPPSRHAPSPSARTCQRRRRCTARQWPPSPPGRGRRRWRRRAARTRGAPCTKKTLQPGKVGVRMHWCVHALAEAQQHMCVRDLPPCRHPCNHHHRTLPPPPPPRTLGLPHIGRVTLGGPSNVHHKVPGVVVRLPRRLPRVCRAGGQEGGGGTQVGGAMHVCVQAGVSGREG